MRKVAFLALVAAGCTTGCTGTGLVVEPVIDLPTNDSASAFPLGNLVLSVAHAGSTADLVSQTFASGQAVELPGVPFGDDLVIHLTGHIGTSEAGYGRTCSLAVTQNVATPAPHLFFSRSVRFGDLALSVPPEPRRFGAGIADIDGAGLVLGGVDPTSSTSPVSDVERFDPRTGELRLLATLDPRIGAVAAPLGIGGDARIAMIGGQDVTTGTGSTFVELLQPDAPVSRRYERIDDAEMSRVGLTATALTDGRLIAIGGQPIGGMPSDAVDEVSIKDGATSVRVLRALLAVPRYDHTATRLGDDVGASVLVAGGLDATGAPVKTAELFKPLAEDFSKTFTGNTMIVARYAHQALLMPDGSVLIFGGIGLGGATVGVTDTLERFSLDAGFVAGGTLPDTAGLVDFAASPLPDGRVLLTGGRRCPDTTVCPALDTAFIVQLDPINGSVNVLATDHMSVPRAGHQSTLLCDGTLLITGGTDSSSVAERYSPPALGRR